ncbi:MAG: FAD-binding protein [Myxococcales bacterium]|nr:FAD-binding protein [Myxococcales bacterium]
MLPREPWPRPSAAAVDAVRRALGRAVGPSKLVTDPDAMGAYAGDESDQEPVLPDAVVLAASADDVAATFAVASEHGVPVTPRAAGSGKSGGCVPVAGGIVLATLGMRALKDIDRREHLAVVEPGIILADLQYAVESEGLFFPPDPNSRAAAALGGNIAENAAGPRAFKYGATRDYVLGLDVVTPTGARLRTGRRTKKGVTGYDVTSLLVGSEGTLAVTVEATLRLVPKPEHVYTVLGLFADGSGSARAVAEIVAAGLVPRCLELVDEACLGAMRQEGVGVDERAGAMLIVEVDGDEPACERALEAVGARLDEAGALDVLVAQDGAQRERLWRVRSDLSHTLRKMARFKIAEDVVVPRTRMSELVVEVGRIGQARGVRTMSYGHAGDGNLHVNFLWDDPAAVPRVEAALRDLFTRVLAMGGTLTGEHGIGSSKAEFLPLEQSPELIRLQRDLKRVFDPQGILNPGKIFPRTGHGSC